MINSAAFLLALIFSVFFVGLSEISSGRIKGADEPHIVSWRVLEGVTEPFESNKQQTIPPWKQMKQAADQKAAALAIQQALHEYGQLLRHPYMFGDMPTEERYDVFLSMAKLLKMMGFHQRAELLLYEAMSYTTKPYETHFQLGLLFLDKEDLEKAKMHLKNCLFFHESEVIILIHLSVILISEGKMHEAKFFLSRVITNLENRVNKLSFLLTKEEQERIKAGMNYKSVSIWLEDLFVKIYYGEFQITPSTLMELLRYFTNLYNLLSAGELTGRFIFDIGQSLYEGGRPRIGQIMMKRGYDTSDHKTEGVVSTEIVRIRLAFDYPMIPDSVLEIVESYFNMTMFLVHSSASYTPIDFDNVYDVYWPLPLIPFSQLPTMPIIKELLWRFHGGPRRNDTLSLSWMNSTYNKVLDQFVSDDSDSTLFVQWSQAATPPLPPTTIVSTPTAPAESSVSTSSAASGSPKTLKAANSEFDEEFDEEDSMYENAIVEKKRSKRGRNNNPLTALLEEPVERYDEIKRHNEKIIDGVKTIVIPPGETPHSHASSTLSKDTLKIEVGILGGHMNNHAVGHMILHRILSMKQIWGHRIHLTLIALPLLPDFLTKQIASQVHRIVNLPLDTPAAWKIIQQLTLDIVLFPDWQPFPDQQSIFFQTRRIAPIQMCFVIHGASCVSESMDYYLLPSELEMVYLTSTPAADSIAIATVTVPRRSKSSGAGGEEESTISHKVLKRALRPLWREAFSEQVVLLDWPILTLESIHSVLHSLKFDSTTAGSPSSSSSSSHGQSSAHYNNNEHTSPSASPTGTTTAAAPFTPLEIEGKIFFEGQPVAILPVHPTHLHPLMDDTLFKIMHALPSLHVVLAVPDSFCTHAREMKHKISWARKLVRRLWSKGGNLFHRIRLLPNPLNEERLLQLLQQADMVLDSFPIGIPFHLLALTLSVGTPIITLQTGNVLHTNKEDLKEIKSYVANRKTELKGNPLASLLLLPQSDIPWSPTINFIQGFYERNGLQRELVASNNSEYYRLATELANNREYAYGLRIRILEAIDEDHRASGTGNSAPATTASTSAAFSAADDVATEEQGSAPGGGAAGSVATVQDCGKCVDDLARFMIRVGMPFAHARKYGKQREG